MICTTPLDFTACSMRIHASFRSTAHKREKERYLTLWNSKSKYVWVRGVSHPSRHRKNSRKFIFKTTNTLKLIFKATDYVATPNLHQRMILQSYYPSRRPSPPVPVRKNTNCRKDVFSLQWWTNPSQVASVVSFFCFAIQSLACCTRRSSGMTCLERKIN